MNKKTKTMFVLQPGAFGSAASIFATYEYEDRGQIADAGWPKRNRAETISVPCVQALGAARQTLDNQNWIRTVVRLPRALRRSVWSPLSRKLQKAA